MILPHSQAPQLPKELPTHSSLPRLMILPHPQAPQLSKELPTHSSLQVDLRDIIAGKQKEQAVPVLKALCDAVAGTVLKKVDLGENALGPQGVQACEGVFVPGLQELSMCNNGLSDEALEKTRVSS